MLNYILFDLDGTLTDPGIGITNSVMYALKKFGIEITDRTSLYNFIGPPLMYSFQTFHGFSEEDSTQAVKYYREYFSVHGLYENEVYPGIPELLHELKQRGYHLVLATSKPEEYALEILRHFGLYDYFDFVAGATFDTTRVKKADVIAYALKETGITDLENTIMIGDRSHDIIGAKTFNLDSIGVLYGYGSEDEFKEAGATYIVNKPCEIIEIENVLRCYIPLIMCR